MPGSNAHHDTSDLDRSMEDIGLGSRDGLGRPKVMGDALREAGLSSNSRDMEDALRGTGLTSNQIQNFSFDYSKMCRDHLIRDEANNENAAFSPDQNKPFAPSAVVNTTDCLLKKQRKPYTARKLDNDKGPVLEEGSIRRALKGALQTFNIQVLGVEFDESLSLYKAIISDGGEKTDRCYFTSKSVSRITKNKLVVIEVVDFMVKLNTLHINKYYILNKESRIIGIPLKMVDIKDVVGPSRLDINLTDAHERLIDDFLRFTGEKSDPAEDEKAASLISGSRGFNYIFQDQQNPALYKVRFDHCYTRCDYFERLENYLDSSKVFAAEEVLVVSNGVDLQDQGVLVVNNGMDIQEFHHHDQAIYMEVGAECEL